LSAEEAHGLRQESKSQEARQKGESVGRLRCKHETKASQKRREINEGIPFDDPLAKAATLAQRLCAIDDLRIIFANSNSTMYGVTTLYRTELERSNNRPYLQRICVQRCLSNASANERGSGIDIGILQTE
jgi:hypothetical protein